MDLEVVEADTAFTCACRRGSDEDGQAGPKRLSIPAKHSWGRYYADAPTLAAMADNGQVVLRYAAGQKNFNGSIDDIAGVRNERGNVFGLMPHPEHAVDELTGSTDGLCIFASMRLAVEGARCPEAATLPTLEDALALGLTRAEYDLICEKQGAPPNQVELAMYSLLWSEHCAYKHSKKLLRTLPTEGPHVVMGPGENAGAVDIGDGTRVSRLQGRVTQPPLRRRAFPRRRDRRGGASSGTSSAIGAATDRASLPPAPLRCASVSLISHLRCWVTKTGRPGEMCRARRALARATSSIAP